MQETAPEGPAGEQLLIWPGGERADLERAHTQLQALPRRGKPAWKAPGIQLRTRRLQRAHAPMRL